MLKTQMKVAGTWLLGPWWKLMAAVTVMGMRGPAALVAKAVCISHTGEGEDPRRKCSLSLSWLWPCSRGGTSDKGAPVS